MATTFRLIGQLVFPDTDGHEREHVLITPNARVRDQANHRVHYGPRAYKLGQTGALVVDLIAQDVDPDPELAGKLQYTVAAHDDRDWFEPITFYAPAPGKTVYLDKLAPAVPVKLNGLDAQALIDEAREARARAEAAEDFVQAPTDEAVATVLATDGSTANTAVTSLVNNQIDRRAVRLGDRDVDAVRQFNAPRDGTTIAAAQLQAATDHAAANGGKRRVILREGRYLGKDTMPWRIPQGTTIQGEGPGTILTGNRLLKVTASDVLFRDVAFVDDSGTGLAELFVQDGTTRNHKNWRFENCTFNGYRVVGGAIGVVDDKGNPITQAPGIADHLELIGCHSQGYRGDGAFWNKGMPHMIVDGTTGRDIGSSTSMGDFIKFSFGGGGRVSRVIAYDGARDFVDLFDGANVTVEHCRAYRFQAHGIESKRTSASNGVGGHKISHNYFEDCALSSPQSGVVLQLSAPNITATDNTVRGGPAGGYRCGPYTDDATKGVAGGTWANNRAINVAGHGFFVVGGLNHYLSGNVASGCQLRGFYVPKSSAEYTGTTAVRGPGNRSWNNGYADDWTGAATA